MPATRFWECPRCGRRIAHAILSCRCGGKRQPSAKSYDPAWKIAAIGVGVVLLFALGWMARRPSGTEGAPEPIETTEAAAVEDASALPPPTPTTPTRSAGEGGTTPRPLEEVIEDVLPAVVSILSSEGTGSGFFVDEETIITNHHVVGGDLSVKIKLRDGNLISGDVERIAEEHDLALVRVRTPLSDQQGLSLLDVEDVRVGQEVLVLGSPLGVLDNSVTRGIVSAVRPTDTTTVVQTDAAINPGNSGGPLVDRNGRVIGIATMKVQGDSLGFAVAAEHARDLVEGGGSRARGQKPIWSTLETVDDLEDLDADQLEIALEQVVAHYADDFATLRNAALRCRELNHRLSEYRGARLDYELGEIVLDYVQQHNNYARSGRRIPDWIDVSCLKVSMVEKCYEGVVVYDDVYKVYVGKRARQGLAPKVPRYLPEI